MRVMTIVLISAATAAGGCAGTISLYGAGGGGGGGGDQPAGEGLVNLAAIDFTTDVPPGEDPVTIALGGGTVEFAGGMAGTLGIIPLYFDDSFAWDLAAGGTATVTFVDLDVRTVQLYFAHDGDTSATLVAEDVEGNPVGTIESFAATTMGDSRARFRIDATDASIARLVIEVPAGATVALDHLVLSVPESGGT